MKKATIIACTLLAAGAVCCVAALGMGARDGLFQREGSSLRALQYKEEAEDKALEQDMKISHLVMDIDNAECVVQVGDKYSLTGGEHVQWKRQGDILTISQEQPDGWWWKSKPANITLTLPYNTLTDLDIELDAGSVVINDLITTDLIRCNVDAGSAEFENVHTGKLELDVDAGEIIFHGQTLGAVELECDAGGIELNLENSSIGHVTGEIDAGEINVTNNGKKVVSQDGFSNTVSTDIPGAAGTDILTFDCDAGSIGIELITEGEKSSDAGAD